MSVLSCVSVLRRPRPRLPADAPRTQNPRPQGDDVRRPEQAVPPGRVRGLPRTQKSRQCVSRARHGPLGGGVQADKTRGVVGKDGDRKGGQEGCEGQLQQGDGGGVLQTGGY